MAPARLEIDGLVCGYGERPLFERLNFTLEEGDVVRVRGANGSGKTTLLRTVAGLRRPLRGQVRWQPTAAVNGELPRLRDQLCFVGHEDALNGALTPVENLAVLMRLSGFPASKQAVRDTLCELGLRRASRLPCARLSAGQRRRVSLARLWLTRAPLWLLDEPASALDSASRAVLAKRIAEHAHRGGLVLLTTHEHLPLPNTALRNIDLPAC